jgi:hypothetical protein
MIKRVDVRDKTVEVYDKIKKSKVRFITGPETQRGIRGIALLIRDLDARRGG